MIQLLLHVCVEQCVIPLSAAPEDKVLAPQPMCDLDGFLRLRRCDGKNLRMWAGGGPMHVPRMLEQLGSAPQRTDSATLCLQLLRERHNFVQVCVGLRPRAPLRSNVTVMEAPKLHTQLLHKLEHGSHAALRHLHRGYQRVLPGPALCGRAEWVGSISAKGVPEGNAEAQPFLHRLAQQQLVRIVVSICHRVGALRALIPDERHIREELSLPKVIGGVAGAAHR
mmetsp:Transcript_4611/g.11459  ORF Transcript_4611/g.11459 Transcript_4611/m.11459 type:complete len:224 (+) Transcript_4611:783-1454(+)